MTTEKIIQKPRFSAEEGEVLMQILALDEPAQINLYRILSSIVGGSHGANLTQGQSTEPSPVEDDDKLQEDVIQWIDELKQAKITSYERVRLLDLEINDSNTDQINKLLETARAEVLDNNPPVAVRRAVIKVASENVVMCTIGGIGLVMAVVSALLTVVKKIF